MKLRLSVLLIVWGLLFAGPVEVSAQLTAAKDGPIVYGHHHLNTTNVAAQKKFFVDTLGGRCDQGRDEQRRDREVSQRPDIFSRG